MTFFINGFIDEFLTDTFIGIALSFDRRLADLLRRIKTAGITLDDNGKEFALIALISDQTVGLIAVKIDTVALIEDLSFAFQLNFEFSLDDIVELLTGVN